MDGEALPQTLESLQRRPARRGAGGDRWGIVAAWQQLSGAPGVAAVRGTWCGRFLSHEDFENIIRVTLGVLWIGNIQIMGTEA